jgi:DUF4097 and DUF4098 domain-containing protein YvlB
MAETRRIDLLDIYLSSFLSLHGVEPKLETKNGKVVFTFEADDKVYRLMNLFNGNVEVPVADFVTTVKTLRGKMLTAKEGIAGKGNGNGERNGHRKES